MSRLSFGLRLAMLFTLLPLTNTMAATPKRFISETPVVRLDYWQKRATEIQHQLAATPSLKSVRIVFIGDSITDFWHLDANPWIAGKFCGRAIWDESFGGAVPSQTALNLGVSGDRIEHVLHRILPKAAGGEGWLDRRDLQPDRIFLMVGINNSYDSEAPATESVTRGVEATIKSIRLRKPHAQIVVQSLLPTDDDTKNRSLVQPVNTALRDFAGRMDRVAFLDLYPAFVDAQGRQNHALFNDGLHPSRDGYRVWRDALVMFLKSVRA